MNQEITSVNNELVKDMVKLQQKKYRDAEGLFLLEGFKPIEEAFLSGIEIQRVFVLKEKISKLGFLSKSQDVISTTEAVLKKISTTDSAPDVVAVAKQKIFKLDDIKSAQKVVLLENIKDAGNLGTILRTAKAFSQDAVVLYGDTVDLYNPKCVRSAVGNLWKLPVVQIKDFEILEKQFASFEKVATLPKADDTVTLKDFITANNSPHPSPHLTSSPLLNPPPQGGRKHSKNNLESGEEATPSLKRLIMFGSEADGLSQDLIDFADKKVTIEMNNDVESLNLSISVGVVLYQTNDFYD